MDRKMNSSSDLWNCSFEFIPLTSSKEPVVKEKKVSLAETIFSQVTDLLAEDDLKKRTIQAWHMKREVTYGLKGVDRGHSCDESCIEGGFIDVISQPLSLYGCLSSGMHHVCNPITNGCKNSIINGDSEYICVYSQRSTGVVIDCRGFYNGADKNRMETKGEIDASVEETQTEKEQFEPEEVGAEEEDVDADADVDWDLKFAEEDEEAKDPEILPTVPCSEESEPTPLEVIMMDCDFDGGSPQSIERRPKKRKCFQENSDLTEEALQIIKDLLYNINDRAAINRSREEELKKSGASAVKKYYKECRGKNIRPSIFGAEERYASIINKKALLNILDFDKRRASYYADICATIWTYIIQSPYWGKNSSTFHFRHHVLGTLYVMKSGDLINSEGGPRNILSRDSYLVENLPDQNDLCNIIPTKGSQKLYSKSDITRGRNNIKQSLNSMKPETKEDLIDDLVHLHNSIERGSYIGVPSAKKLSS